MLAGGEGGQGRLARVPQGSCRQGGAGQESRAYLGEVLKEVPKTQQ